MYSSADICAWQVNLLCSLSMANVFKNPIITGFNPDPSVVRVGSDYFLATSTFEYFPGLAIYHSKDLLNWEHIGHALTRRSQLDMRTVEPGAGIWAPTFRWRKDQGGETGRFYLATGSFNRYRPKTDVSNLFPQIYLLGDGEEGWDCCSRCMTHIDLAHIIGESISSRILCLH